MIISGSNKLIQRELKFKTCKQAAKDKDLFYAWKTLVLREMHITSKDPDYEQEIANIKNLFVQRISVVDTQTYKKGVRKDKVPLLKTEEDLRDFVCEKLPNYFVYKKQLYRSFGTHWDECEMAYLSEDVHSVVCRVKNELERGYAPDYTMEKIVNRSLHHFREFVSMILAKITERVNPIMGDQNDFKLFIKDYNFNFETGTDEATYPTDYNGYSLNLDMSKAISDEELWSYLDSLFEVKTFNRETKEWEIKESGRKKAEDLLREIAKAYLKIEDKKGFFVFYGPSNTGKTTFVNLLIKAFGCLVYPSMPLSFFNGRHTKEDRNVLSEIVEKRFVVCSEVPKMEELDSYAIKTLSSNDYVTVEKKFKAPQTVAPALTLIFTTNDLSLKDGGFGGEDIRNRCRSYGFFNHFEENCRTQKKIESEGYAAALIRNIERLGVEELNRVMETNVTFCPRKGEGIPASLLLSSIFGSFKNPYDVKFKDFLKQFNLDAYVIGKKDLEKLLEENGYCIVCGRGRYRYVRKGEEEDLSELPEKLKKKVDKEKAEETEAEKEAKAKDFDNLLMEDLTNEEFEERIGDDDCASSLLEETEEEEDPEEKQEEEEEEESLLDDEDETEKSEDNEEEEEEEIDASQLSKDQGEIPAWMTVINRPEIVKFKEFKLTDRNHDFTIIKPDGNVQPNFKKTANHGPKGKKGGKKRKK